MRQPYKVDLRDQIIFCERRKVFNLGLFPRRGLAEFFGHEVSYLRSDFNTCSCVEEKRAGAASEDVFYGSCHLKTGGPNHFNGGVGKAGMKGLPESWVFFDEII